MMNVTNHTSYSIQYTYKSIVFFSYLFIIDKPKKVQDSTNTANNEEQKDIDNSNEKDNGGGKTNQSTGKRRFKFGTWVIKYYYASIVNVGAYITCILVCAYCII